MFFDIGSGEFLLIALVAVLLLGPDRLPKAVAEGARWLRAFRDQANRARSDIMDAANFDPSMTQDLRQTLSDIGELHRAGCVAITDDGHPVATAVLLRRALEYAAMFGMPVIEHCEDSSLKGDGVAHERLQ